MQQHAGLSSTNMTFDSFSLPHHNLPNHKHLTRTTIVLSIQHPSVGLSCLCVAIACMALVITLKTEVNFYLFICWPNFEVPCLVPCASIALCMAFHVTVLLPWPCLVPVHIIAHGGYTDHNIDRFTFCSCSKRHTIGVPRILKSLHTHRALCDATKSAKVQDMSSPSLVIIIASCGAFQVTPLLPALSGDSSYGKVKGFPTIISTI